MMFKHPALLWFFLIYVPLSRGTYGNTATPTPLWVYPQFHLWQNFPSRGRLWLCTWHSLCSLWLSAR